jgi:hypothetical protein
MRTGPYPRRRRSLALAAGGILALALTACTGRGGGQLPPDNLLFYGPASFGFAFSCEDASTSASLNSPVGQLRIQLAYSDRGRNPIGSSFSIHGTVDTIEPEVESIICIGQNPPPGVNELIFLGRFRLLSSAPAGFPSTCPARETASTPLCRFEVIVRDNDMDRAPSKGDFFQIKLSSATDLRSQLDPPDDQQTSPVFYTRAGVLSSGNLTVD